MSSLSDVAMRAMQATLGGLQQRIDVRSHNVANSATPGFRATQVDFESALADALERGDDPAGVRATATASMALPNGQGNTVDMAGEMVGMIKDNLAYDTAVAVFNHKAGILGTALRGQ